MPRDCRQRDCLTSPAKNRLIWNGQIVPLEIDAPGSRLLRLRRVQRQSACNDQHRCGYDSSPWQVNLLLVISSPAVVI